MLFFRFSTDYNMTRNYKKRSGSKYMIFSKEALKNAVNAYVNGHMSLRKAEQIYRVPKSTIQRATKGKRKKSPGGQVALTSAIESMLVDKLLTCASWGYPMDTLELRLFVKSYLESREMTVKSFKNNLPGIDWAKSFLIRHHAKLSERLVPNIKRARAEVSRHVVNEYFDRLELTLDNVPPGNIVNYDETNLSDNPGEKKSIVRRGCKHPERVQNATKSSFSVMFAGSAEGEILPVYVVYKAEHMWSTWLLNGPPKARYNRTKSGWFDGKTFEDWFFKVAMPYFRNKEGPKALIGDNLQSHLSKDIVTACEENDIRFIFLPKNSTHLTQPLDVAFFAPLKRAWRDILSKWKMSDGRHMTSLPKECFPGLLRQLISKIEEGGRGAETLQAGFRKTGICPIRRQSVLDMLPEETASNVDSENMSDSLIAFLQHLRHRPTRSGIPIRRRQKLNVKAGESVSANDFESELSEDDQHPWEAETDAEMEATKSNSDADSEENLQNTLSIDNENMEPNPDRRFDQITEGTWLLVELATVNRKKKKFVGQVTAVLEDQEMDCSRQFRMKFVKPYRYSFAKACCVWPEQADESDVMLTEILQILRDPVTTRRGLLEFCDLDTITL